MSIPITALLQICLLGLTDCSMKSIAYVLKHPLLMSMLVSMSMMLEFLLFPLYLVMYYHVLINHPKGVFH